MTMGKSADCLLAAQTPASPALRLTRRAALRAGGLAGLLGGAALLTSGCAPAAAPADTAAAPALLAAASATPVAPVTVTPVTMTPEPATLTPDPTTGTPAGASTIAPLQCDAGAKPLPDVFRRVDWEAVVARVDDQLQALLRDQLAPAGALGAAIAGTMVVGLIGVYDRDVHPQGPPGWTATPLGEAAARLSAVLADLLAREGVPPADARFAQVEEMRLALPHAAAIASNRLAKTLARPKQAGEIWCDLYNSETGKWCVRRCALC